MAATLPALSQKTYEVAGSSTPWVPSASSSKYIASEVPTHGVATLALATIILR